MWILIITIKLGKIICMIRNSEYKKLNVVTCDCVQCRKMCEKSVCLPTPEQARVLIDRGYSDRLSIYEFHPTQKYIGPSPKSQEGQPQNSTLNDNGCTFYENGLCSLHDLGLKPYEGTIAHHDRDWKTVRMDVLKTWTGKKFESVEKKLKR